MNKIEIENNLTYVKNFTKKFHELLGVSDGYQAPETLMNILYDREKRESMFREMLTWFDYNVDFDWFHQYFQEEHAERQSKKQDFTPETLARLLAGITHPQVGEIYYEVAAGSGGLMISSWDYQRRQVSPLAYEPMDYFYVVEELSERTIPFLLFNMMLRGMNGVVIHCDTLTREAKGVFFIQNFTNNFLGFSDLNVLPYTEDIETYFGVNFVEELYPEHKERSWFDFEENEEIKNVLANYLNRKEMRRRTQEDDNLDDNTKAFLASLGL